MIYPRRILGISVAGALALASSNAQAGGSRSASEIHRSELVAGVSTFLLLALIVAAAGVVLFATDDDKDVPTSP